MTKKELQNRIGMGGAVNTRDHVPAIGYNPTGSIEWTDAAPYKLIVHQRLNGIHFWQVFHLDDYKGNVLSWDDQQWEQES